MTTSHQIDQQVKRDILATIDGDGYDETPKTIDEKRAFLANVFASEYGWRIKHIGRQRALMEWLQGLPTVINIPFSHCAVLQYAVKIGSLPESYTKKQADKILNNYWNFMACKIAQIMDGYHMPK